MICICSTCHIVRGERAPFDDTRETHGLCPDCLQKQLIFSGISEKEVQKTLVKCHQQEALDIIEGTFKPKINRS